MGQIRRPTKFLNLPAAMSLPYSLARLRIELRGARPSYELLCVFAKSDLLDAARAGGFSGVLSANSSKEMIVRAVLRLLEVGNGSAVKIDDVVGGDDEEDADFVEAADPSRATPWAGAGLGASGGGAGGAGAGLSEAETWVDGLETKVTVPIDARAADGANVTAVDFDADGSAWDFASDDAAPAAPLASLIRDTSASVRSTSHAHERILLVTHPHWLVTMPITQQTPAKSEKRPRTETLTSAPTPQQPPSTCFDCASRNQRTSKKEMGTQWSPPRSDTKQKPKPQKGE